MMECQGSEIVLNLHKRRTLEAAAPENMRLVWCGEKRAEPKDLHADVRFHPHLWTKALRSEQNIEIVDTGRG